MSTVVLVAALVAAGLIAGLFYAYACSVLPGLARGDDKTFVEGMRGINVAIINPVFMLTFLGAPLLAGVAVFLHFGSPSLPWVAWPTMPGRTTRRTSRARLARRRRRMPSFPPPMTAMARKSWASRSFAP